ncbi:MAG: YidC/Oxa1 family membrane protein insertase [Chloroflexi bacterium]|nr:YidC/Oxa1 family membrane protein insertase [Chloroflexota bacterium]
MIDFVSLVWGEVITKPMTNSLLLLYVLLANNLGLAIIAFTVLVRGATFKLVVRQVRQTRKMQELGPRMKVINEKFKNDPKRKQQEVMAAYKEMGMNPVGCLGPMVIQMPIFIGLFWAINFVVPFTPESLAGLASKLYGWLPVLDTVVPVNRGFLGMDLAIQPMQSGNPLAFFLVGLSGLTMYVQQKMTQSPSADAQQQSQQRMMTLMFPIVFGFFSLVFPVGLVLYWVASNGIGIVMQYFIIGRPGLKSLLGVKPQTGPRLGPTLTEALPDKELGGDGQSTSGTDGEDSRGSDRTGVAGTRRRPRRSRGRRR